MSLDAAVHRIRGLKHRDPLLRLAAAERLPKLPATRETGEAALKALTDGNPTVRRHMIEALVKARNHVPGVLAVLVRMLDDQDDHVQRTACAALREMGLEAIPTLLRLVQAEEGTKRIRLAALRLLTEQMICKDYPVLPFVRKRLRRERWKSARRS